MQRPPAAGGRMKRLCYVLGRIMGAGILGLVLLQLYMAHEHTSSAQVANGVGGRLNGLWARLKGRNFTIPKFPSASRVVRQAQGNVTAANTTTRNLEARKEHMEQQRQIERKIKNELKVWGTASLVGQDSASVAALPVAVAQPADTTTTGALRILPTPTAHMHQHQNISAVTRTNGTLLPPGVRASWQQVVPGQHEAVSGNARVRSTGAKRVLIFTMDSTFQTIEAAKHGGPAGEITIRTSLQSALQNLGFELDVPASDAEYAKLSQKALAHRVSAGTHYYTIIIMDPWTWAEPVREPSTGALVRVRPLIANRPNATFILDFFGNKKLAVLDVGLTIPKHHSLTAFPSPFGEAFLGFFFSDSTRQYVDDLTFNLTQHHLRTFGTGTPHQHGVHHLHRGVDLRHSQGVIWGKKSNYFTSVNGKSILKAAAALSHLISLLPSSAGGSVLKHKNIKHVGHQTKVEFRTLMANSKFLLGLGDPVSGPSALEAMLVGSMFINPTFKGKGFPDGNPNYPVELRKHYTSQHPYMEQHVGAPYVCSFNMLSLAQPNITELEWCIRTALNSTLRPRIPDEFTHDSYSKRVRHIFALFL